MSGEFTSMSAIYAVMPDFCPRPVAWGSYASIPDVNFFLYDFHKMTDKLPDLHTFPANLAELHHKGTSENGKYGFPCRTYYGDTSLDHGWAAELLAMKPVHTTLLTTTKQQNELHHNILLLDVNTDTRRDHTARMTDLAHSITDCKRQW